MYWILETDSCLNDLIHRLCDNSPFVYETAIQTDFHIIGVSYFLSSDSVSVNNPFTYRLIKIDLFSNNKLLII